MRIVRGLESYRPESIAAAVALGAFDGIHLGHRAILATAVTQARQGMLRPVACTFDRHPMEVLQPDKAPLPNLHDANALLRLVRVSRNLDRTLLRAGGETPEGQPITGKGPRKIDSGGGRP